MIVYLEQINVVSDKISNVSNASNITESERADGVQTVIYCIAVVLVCFEFTTNFLVIELLSTRKTLRTKRYTVLVMSLGVADFVISLAGVVWLVSQRLGPQSAYLCGSATYIWSLGMFMSFYFTFLISLNRYLTALNSAWTNKLFGYGRKYILMLIPSVVMASTNPIFAINWNKEIMFCQIGTMV